MLSLKSSLHHKHEMNDWLAELVHNFDESIERKNLTQSNALNMHNNNYIVIWKNFTSIFSITFM